MEQTRQMISIPMPSKRVIYIGFGLIVGILLIVGAIFRVKADSLDANKTLLNDAQNAIAPYGGQLLQSDGKILVEKATSSAIIAWQDSTGQRHFSLEVNGKIVSDRLAAAQ